MKLRDMEVADVKVVSQLENRCFPTPWSEQMIYEDLVSNHRAHFYVAEKDDSVVGYVGIWKAMEKVHITTIAVDSSTRRQGIATALVETVIDKHAESDRPVTLEVRPSNTAALELYESLGFELSGRRKNYYSDNQEDALIMDYRPPVRGRVGHGRPRIG